MKRRLVKQGTATLMISLPSKWIQANNLGKGDEIDIDEKNNTLFLSTSSKVNKEIVIKITNNNRKDLKNILTHAYRKGFNKILLQGSFQDSIREIRSIVNNLLMGFEITEHDKSQLILENISEPTEQKYDILIKKLFHIVKETQEIILADSKSNKFNNFQEIEDLKKQHDRFILFCRRVLIKGNTGKALITQWEFLTFLMHIEHNYFYLYKYLSSNKISSKRLFSLILELNNYFELYEDAYLNKNIESIHKINLLKEKFQFGDCIKLLEQTKGSETVALSYIREIFRLIQIGTSPLLIESLD
jgi:phosphate uptake regulator